MSYYDPRDILGLDARRGMSIDLQLGSKSGDGGSMWAC
jgi:hypothetical protein